MKDKTSLTFDSLGFGVYDNILPFVEHLPDRHDPYISKQKQSNNDPCKCYSGKKYKKCCKFK